MLKKINKNGIVRYLENNYKKPQITGHNWSTVFRRNLQFKRVEKEWKEH